MKFSELKHHNKNTFFCTNNMYIDVMGDTLIFQDIEFDTILKVEEDNINKFYNLHYVEKEDDSSFDFNFYRKVKSIEFWNCTFEEKVYINKNLNNLRIDYCIFNKDFLINNYSYISSSNSNTQEKLINRFDIETCTFYSNFEIKQCRFDYTYIKDCNVNGDFKLSSIILNHTIQFENNILNGLAVFEMILFYCNIDFKYVVFKGNLFFSHIAFFEGLNLDYTYFGQNTTFFDIHELNSEKSINNTTRNTYRIIKQQLLKSEDIIESNKYKAIELTKYRKDIWSKDYINGNLLRDGLILFFHFLSSNHSQNWFLPITWIFGIGIITSHCISDINLFNIFKFMYIATPLDDFKDNTIWIFFNKILLGYLYYQFLVTIRKDSK